MIKFRDLLIYFIILTNYINKHENIRLIQRVCNFVVSYMFICFFLAYTFMKETIYTYDCESANLNNEADFLTR